MKSTNTLSQAQHTPGPWSIVDSLNIAGNSGQPGGRYVCSVCDWSFPASSYKAENDKLHEEGAANARLIASAPCLLAALEEMERDATENYGGDANECARIERARNAIARAKGGAS